MTKAKYDVWELPQFWAAAIRHQWRSRGVLGKLVFPVWLLAAAALWAVVVALMLLALLVGWLRRL